MLCPGILAFLLLVVRIAAENDAGILFPVPDDDPKMLLWPMPELVTMGSTTVGLNAKTFKFVMAAASSSALINEAINRYMDLIFFASRFSESTFSHTISECKVEIEKEGNWMELGESEEYALDINLDKCTIRSKTDLGALRALETFSNLIDWTEETGYILRGLPLHIEDKPRYAWRGFLIDSARRFLPKNIIKRIIDALSYNKMNILHWHLTDAESFPLISKKRPELVKGAFSPKATYSLDDLKEISQYAIARGVRVMAEIDTPGHTGSWGIGMPDLVIKCQDEDGNLQSTSLNPLNPEVFEVINDIMMEVTSVLPFGFIHLGSDELLLKCWAQDNAIRQDAMNSGKDITTHTRHLYCSFVDKVIQIAKLHGRQPVVWDDIIKDAGCNIHLDRNSAIIQIWHGHMAAAVANQGYRMISSVEKGYYLNNGWERQQSWARFEEVYNIDPAADLRNGDNTMGGELAMWGEATDSTNYFQHSMARLSAGAEKLWSNNPALSLDDAKKRIVRKRCQLFRRGIPVRALDFDNGDWRRGRLYQCEVYLLDVAAARGWDLQKLDVDMWWHGNAHLVVKSSSSSSFQKGQFRELSPSMSDTEAQLVLENNQLRMQLKSIVAASNNRSNPIIDSAGVQTIVLSITCLCAIIVLIRRK